LPAETAESIEMWLMTFSARVTLHEVETLDGNVELRFVGVIEQHELAGAWANVECLQTAEARDAVVDVDHVIAGLEIAEVGKESSRFRFAPALFTALCTLGAGGLSLNGFGGFVEDVCFDVYDQVRLRQFKAAAETSDSDDDGAGSRGLGRFAC